MSKLKQTRVYQEALEEGELKAGWAMVLRQLQQRLGSIPDGMKSQVNQLDLPRLESLGEALLDFSQLSDLKNWLQE